MAATTRPPDPAAIRPRLHLWPPPRSGLLGQRPVVGTAHERPSAWSVHERKLAPHQERLWHRRQEFASETTVSTWTRYRQSLSEAAGEWPMCAESRNRVVARSLRRRAREGESDGRVRDLSGQTRRVPIPLPCEHGRDRGYEHRVPNQGRGKDGLGVSVRKRRRLDPRPRIASKAATQPMGLDPRRQGSRTNEAMSRADQPERCSSAPTQHSYRPITSRAQGIAA